MYIIEQAQVKGGRSYGKISTEPRRDTDRQRDDVPLSQTGLDEKTVPGQHLYHRPAGVFQNQYDARRVGYGFAAGKHQGLFGERRGDIHPGNDPQPDGGNLFLYGLSGKETARLADAVGRSEIIMRGLI